jgi:acyl carrier protein
VRGGYWFVRRKRDNYLVGSAGLVYLDYGRYSVQWGFGVDPNLWGEGYIFRIQEILKEYVFDVLRLNRLDGVCMETNIRTISSVTASGMKHEGILRDYYFNGRDFINGWYYSMIRSDYEASLQTEAIQNSHEVSAIMDIVAGVIKQPVDFETSMMSTPKWDSLNHMTIMLELTNLLGVKLTPLQVARATSIKAIHEILSGN